VYEKKNKESGESATPNAEGEEAKTEEKK